MACWLSLFDSITVSLLNNKKYKHLSENYMSPRASLVSENRESVLRTFARLFSVILILTALLLAFLTWQRTVSNEHQRLAHTGQLMAQGMRSHLSTFELLLNSMADELVYRDVFTNPAAGDAFLARAQETDVGLVGFGLVGLDGEFISASTRELRAPLPNVVTHGESRESFQRVVEEGRFHIGRPYFFEAVGEWIIPMRVPVYDDQGQLRAVLTAGNRLDGGHASWARMPISSATYLSVVRADGYLNYLHPLPLEQQRRNELFTEVVPSSLQDILTQGRGFYHYQDTALTGPGASYLWIEPVADYDLAVISATSRSAVVQRWMTNMVMPSLLWLIFALVTWLGYQRAARLLRRADREVQDKREALQRSISQYHELTRLIPIGVYQFKLTQQGRHEMTYTSERFRELLGLQDALEQSDSLAQYVYNQLHPEDALAFYKQQERATKETRDFYWEGRLIQGQKERWVSVHSVPSNEPSENGRLWNGVVADITERKEAEHQINLLAFYDALTQLPNRRLLRQRLEKAVRIATAKEEFAALLFIDVDKFKQLNDSYGHAEGDRMLREIGDRLEELVRDYDTVARLGGDEFVVLLSRLSNQSDKAAAEVEVVLQKIERLLNEPFRIGQQTTRITLSTGITLIDGSEDDIDIILQQADQAMYRAKDAGRNTQCFYDANIQQMITEQLELQQDLRHAMNHDELELYYQLQLDREQQVAGVEALIRWHHPTRGMVMPGVFIHIAEQSGEIVALGDWILQRACRQLVEWQNHATRSDWTIAVNVSVRQLRAEDFAEKVLITLAETGAKPDKLVLEITESMLLVDTEQVIEKMARLKRVGVKFSLDDFGTGYSSLGYLNRLPIDELKIDQSFVRDMNQGEHHKVLIRTILSLGHTLSLTTIAEGVESEEHFRSLLALGCDRFQGYYFAKPVPPDQLP
ncbi:hypothetical protein CWE14_05145 [Aliidiomarina soli]|uniref:cyclic-guanylate-specific phosphodiesterase n=1 Tax=Aliidiomarina soli TaxID=1928574 RepID=A0A432WJI6_9GAMM|nr:hypothetical protein CWE14_05145 [Aliidiomarina soli]